ncbi:Synaptic vesicular amine transporter [Holothuria leucospilota]|uniref:Synaptic vesicular amine transporter n=1 Tax=Holothuria leucospilota TaxID=206669 RepID=A0A9Q1HEW9_HOLLE|nr:Synaptic vesicular amine transporter [Holothuria leucospilota]
MRDLIASYQDTKVSVLVLACIIGFIDEALMTVPVPIIPNLFLAGCQADLVQESFTVPSVKVNENRLCSEYLSSDFNDVCYGKNLSLANWTLSYISNGHIQKCSLSKGVTTCSNLSAHVSLAVTDNDNFDHAMLCYEGLVTREMCQMWTQCANHINVQVGIILSSKFVMRIILSPFLAVIPKYTGFLPVYYISVIIGVLSCTVYSISGHFYAILAGRLLHGWSASMLTVGNGGLLNYVFRHDDGERGLALGTYISFMALGSVVGPPFGGLFFSLLGNYAPYAVLGAFYVLFICAMFVLLKENTKDESVENSGLLDLLELIMDPYIAVCTLGFIFAGCSVSIIESALPHWMISTMSSAPWIQGIIYLPMAGMAVPCGILAGFAGKAIPRWGMVMVGNLCIGSSLVAIPLCTSAAHLILPMVLLGAGFGTLDSVLSAMISRFGYERHDGMYAPSVVICGIAFSFGFALGPSIMGTLINIVGFQWLITGLGCMVLPFALSSFFLRIGENGVSDFKGEDDREKSLNEKEELLKESLLSSQDGDKEILNSNNN